MKCVCGGEIGFSRCTDCAMKTKDIAEAWQLRAERAEADVENAERSVFEAFREDCKQSILECGNVCESWDNDWICHFDECQTMKKLHEHKEGL